MAQDDAKRAKAKIVYPEIAEEDKPLYSNGILVNHTPWDFAIHFSHLVAPVIAQPNPAGEIEIKAKKVTVISIPATLVRGFISALQINLERYEKAYGKIETPKNERPK